jgi:hydroxyacylglutathione hydrolase
MDGLTIEVVPILKDNYAFLLTDRASGRRAVVDPGEAGPVLGRLGRDGGGVDLVLLTHHHGDHTGGVAAVVAATGARVVGPAAEAARIAGLDAQVREGDTVALGASVARVLATPGHTAGHIAFVLDTAGALFCGDTLFVMGCGRLLERDAATMWGSLTKLMGLPDATRVYCGHEYTAANARFALTVDPDNPALVERAAEVERLRAAGLPTVPSTIGEEKATNPFLRAGDPAIRARLDLERASDAEVFAEIRARKDKA